MIIIIIFCCSLPSVLGRERHARSAAAKQSQCNTLTVIALCIDRETLRDKSDGDGVCSVMYPTPRPRCDARVGIDVAVRSNAHVVSAS